MPSPRDIRRRIKSVRKHGADHQGDADGGGVENAQGPAGRARRAALCDAAEPVPAQGDARSASDFTHPLLEVREVRKRAVILIGTDKGLCGALNSNLFRVAAQFDPADHRLHHRRTQSRAVCRPHPRGSLLAEFAYGDSPRFTEAGPLPPLPAICS